MRERLSRDQSAAIMHQRRVAARREHRAGIGPCGGSGRSPFDMSGEQGECVVCGDLFTLRKDGTVRKHDERRNLNPQWRAIESAQRIGRLYRRVAVRSGAVDELELFSP